MCQEIILGNIVDVVKRKIFPGEITLSEGLIYSIKHLSEAPDVFIIPGLIDAHVHIESSMLVPSEFAKAAVRHGTVAVVSDPHEIANVLGVNGVLFMLENAKKTNFKFFFGAPSCVPATQYETAGARIGLHKIEDLLGREDIFLLSEIMNYPDVIRGDNVVKKKIKIAKGKRKVIDGHAPGLRGEDLKKYISAGISTDHECLSMEEALEKLENGMKVIIREGSAAKNSDVLFELIDKYPGGVMLCTDDIHPDDLENGHIDNIIRRGISKGLNLFNILRAATINPVTHYKIDCGSLQQGDKGDLIIVDSLKDFNILATYIEGKKVFDGKKILLDDVGIEKINHFVAKEIYSDDLTIQAGSVLVKIIEARDGSLVTGKSIMPMTGINGSLVTDPEKDILKISVLNRYQKTSPSLGFIKGFGLKKGAIAGSVAHDSHNIIAIGANDKDLKTAINKVIQLKGGLVVAEDSRIDCLELPVAGLMSDRDVFSVAKEYRNLLKRSKELGSKLTSAFMTMSFMTLLVIPELKISDKGLFDTAEFRITSLYA